MSSLLSLPPELLVQVCQQLPLTSLLQCQSVCRHLNSVINVHEDHIFHFTCYVHGFIASPFQELREYKLANPHLRLDGVNTWKALCKKHYLVGDSWEGRGPSALKRHIATGERVFRFKVDEKAGFVISSAHNGGICVTDIGKPGVMLWSLGVDYLGNFSESHIEYDNGFLVFNNPERDDAFEVWRRADQFPDSDSDIGGPNLPDSVDAQQLAASERAARRHGGTLRGHFKPWALLDPRLIDPGDTPTRAFRLVYPTFVAASARVAYFYDIPTASPSGLINIGDPRSPARRVTYAELSRRHFFVCWGGCLFVYLRPDVPDLDLDLEGGGYRGGDQVFRMSSSAGENWFGPWYVQLKRSPPMQSRDSDVLRGGRSMRPVPLVVSYQHTRKYDEFVAVHSSPDSSVVVIVTLSGTCRIISDFNAVVQGKVQTRDAFIVVDLWSGAADSFRYISYDHDNDRIAVSTSRRIAVLKLVWKEEKLITDNEFRDLSPMRRGDNLFLDRILVSEASLPCQTPLCMSMLTCLQITDTRLWLTYRSDSDDFEEHGYAPLVINPLAMTVFSVDMQEGKDPGSLNLPRLTYE